MTVEELRDLLKYASITRPKAQCYFTNQDGRYPIEAVRIVEQDVDRVISTTEGLTKDRESRNTVVLLTENVPYRLVSLDVLEDKSKSRCDCGCGYGHDVEED